MERQFIALHERLSNMGIDIAGLAADEETLATVIPELATEITDLQTHLNERETELTAKVSELTAKEAALAADDAELATVKTELATAQGELATVETIKQKLDPTVEKASGLVPAPAGGGGTSEGGGGTAAALPLYTFDGADPSTIDTTVWTKADVQATDGRALYTFSGDTAGQPPTGSQEGAWTVYEGATEAVPAAPLGDPSSAEQQHPDHGAGGTS